MKHIFFILIVLSGCANGASTESSKSNWLSKYPSQWRAQNPGKDYSIRLDSQIKRHTDSSLRFELRHGETWQSDEGHKSYRSEVTAGGHVAMGSEKFYGFSLYLPQDFPIENNRLILAQWWPLTKQALGEVHRSPVLQFRFADGHLSIRLRLNQKKITTDPEDYEEEKLYDIHQYPLGQWNDFVVKAKWSPTKDGLLNIWLNGKQIVTYVGQTEYLDEVGPKFKFGLYRDDTSKTYVSYMSEVRIGDSFKQVNPATSSR